MKRSSSSWFFRMEIKSNRYSIRSTPAELKTQSNKTHVVLSIEMRFNLEQALKVTKIPPDPVMVTA